MLLIGFEFFHSKEDKEPKHYQIKDQMSHIHQRIDPKVVRNMKNDNQKNAANNRVLK